MINYVYDGLKLRFAYFYLMAAFSKQEFEHNFSVFSLLFFTFRFYLISFINLFLLVSEHCLLTHTFRYDGMSV